jgi:hypothetical protein
MPAVGLVVVPVAVLVVVPVAVLAVVPVAVLAVAPVVVLAVAPAEVPVTRQAGEVGADLAAHQVQLAQAVLLGRVAQAVHLGHPPRQMGPLQLVLALPAVSRVRAYQEA